MFCNTDRFQAGHADNTIDKHRVIMKLSDTDALKLGSEEQKWHHYVAPDDIAPVGQRRLLCHALFL